MTPWMNDLCSRPRLQETFWSRLTRLLLICGFTLTHKSSWKILHTLLRIRTQEVNIPPSQDRLLHVYCCLLWPLSQKVSGNQSQGATHQSHYHALWLSCTINVTSERHGVFNPSSSNVTFFPSLCRMTDILCRLSNNDAISQRNYKETTEALCWTQHICDTRVKPSGEMGRGLMVLVCVSWQKAH